MGSIHTFPLPLRHPAQCDLQNLSGFRVRPRAPQEGQGHDRVSRSPHRPAAKTACSAAAERRARPSARAQCVRQVAFRTDEIYLALISLVLHFCLGCEEVSSQGSKPYPEAEPSSERVRLSPAKPRFPHL